jgi:RNA polymerase sigma factor for flagellar operon FliA
MLSLYYRDELTMKEVGSVLGLTESRVSQLHTSAVLRLRATLEVSSQRIAQAG